MGLFGAIGKAVKGTAGLAGKAVKGSAGMVGKAGRAATGGPRGAVRKLQGRKMTGGR